MYGEPVCGCSCCERNRNYGGKLAIPESDERLIHEREHRYQLENELEKKREEIYALRKILKGALNDM